MRGVTGRVLGEVDDDPTECGLVADHARGRDSGRVDPQPVVGAQAPRLLEHEIVEIDGPPLERQGLLVGAGEQEQILDETLHAQVFGEHALGELGRRRAVRVRERDLGLLADGRDG